MSLLSRLAAVTNPDYVVFAPDQTAAAVAWAADPDYPVTRTAALAAMAQELRADGWFVTPPRPDPDPLSTWTPSEGHAQARQVLGVEAGRVSYRLPDGTAHSCTLASWHKWRAAARAKVAG